MGLDIDKLRLTDDEKNVGGLYSIHSQQRDYVAEAQLAKDWWGFRDWLETNYWSNQDHPIEDGVIHGLILCVEQALEQANIERPTGQKETGLCPGS